MCHHEDYKVDWPTRTETMATDKEIEAVARAICEAEGFDWVAQTDAMTSASGGDNEQDHYRHLALAALTAAEQVRAPRMSTISARTIANGIVNQALGHEDAIETKISVATLLLGIEAALVDHAAEQARAGTASDFIEMVYAIDSRIQGKKECLISAEEWLKISNVLCAEQVKASEPAENRYQVGFVNGYAKAKADFNIVDD